MRTAVIARCVSLISLGLIAGILVGYLAGKPARDQLGTASFVEYQQLIHVYYQRMMQVLMAMGVLSTLILLFTGRQQARSMRFALVAISLVGLIIVFMITLLVNVPINEQLMTWSISSPPSDVREIWHRWEQAHFYRTIISLVAFVSAVLAAVVGRDD